MTKAKINKGRSGMEKINSAVTLIGKVVTYTIVVSILVAICLLVIAVFPILFCSLYFVAGLILVADILNILFADEVNYTVVGIGVLMLLPLLVFLNPVWSGYIKAFCKNWTEDVFWCYKAVYLWLI